MDKSKFTRDPQLDSEGFTLADPRCYGCSPEQPCPQSGSCERYNSPLRFVGFVDRTNRISDEQLCALVGEVNEVRVTLGSDPLVPRDQFGRRYITRNGKFIGVERI